MRRALLTGAAAIALLVAGGTRHASHAVLGVGDICANCATEFSQIMSWAKQASDMAQQLQKAEAQVQQGRMMYQAVTHVTDLGSAVSALGMLGVRNPLPINPYALQGLLNGQGGAQGMLANLGGLYTGARASNSTYRLPDASSWIGGLINRQADAIAGTQAAALQIHQAAAERSDLIVALQARIATAATPAEREALTARLVAEQNQVAGLAVQATAVQTFGQQQALAFEQAQRERMHQGIDAVLAQAKARGIF